MAKIKKAVWKAELRSALITVGGSMLIAASMAINDPSFSLSKAALLALGLSVIRAAIKAGVELLALTLKKK